MHGLAAVRSLTEVSKTLVFDVGEHQGSTLSLLLFNQVIGYFTKDISPPCHGDCYTLKHRLIHLSA